MSAAPSLVLLGGSVSPFVRKVRVALAEKGLEYRHEQVNPFAPPPGWRDKSPLGRIPVLQVGERFLADSSVICAYLEKRFPQPPLYPSDPYDYARALWIEEYMDGGVVPAVGPKVFFPLVLKPFLSGGQPPDAETEAAAQRAWEEQAVPLLAYLERELGDRAWFVGDALTIADITVAAQLVNVRHAGFAPDRKRFPRLRAFLDRMWSRPSLKGLIEEETPIFGRRSERIPD
jgi:glutathione S-transferase